MKTISQWTELVSDDSDKGFRAAWLLARNAMTNGNYTRARNIVMCQPRLANHTLGREIVARLTFLEGDEEGAVQLFSALENESIEAQMFLARRAFKHRQWAEARRLNRLLLDQFPDWTTVRRQILELEQMASNPGVGDGKK
ncbi:MAG: hypothetical protein WCP06_10265 [Verrucomicrobiota bacterium]